MPNYSPNINLKGAKVVYTSQSATSLGSSSLVPLLILPVDESDLQNTFSYSNDGYQVATTNTSRTSVIYTSTRATPEAANELRGQYCFCGALGEAVLIDASSAVAASKVTLTLAQPFSRAVTAGDTVVVRKWEKLKVPKLMSSLDEFASQYMSVSNNAYNWTSSKAAHDTIERFKAGGGGFFIACPVAVDSLLTSPNTASALNFQSDASFLYGLSELPIVPDAIVLSKQPSLPVVVTAADWATVDTAWIAFVDARATQDTSDEHLGAMVYITDTPSASTSAAVTYRATTLAATSGRAVLCHGLHMANNGLTTGQRELNCAALYAGCMNKISTQATESFAHAFSGVMSQVGQVSALSEKVSQSSRVTLQSNGINALIFQRNVGYIFENQLTMRATTSTAGENPDEHLHVLVTRNKIWNSARWVLRALVDEQNVVAKRESATARLKVLLDSYKQQRIIRDATVVDVTTAADESLGVARFAMSVLFPVPIGYVELTINSRI